MNFNAKRLISFSGPLFVAAAAIVFLLGIYHDIGWLVSVLPGKAAIKAISAIMFVEAAVALLCLQVRNERIQVVGSTATLSLLVTILYLSASFNEETLISLQRFFIDETSTVESLGAGIPSLCTLGAFIICAFALLTFMISESRRITRLLFASIATTGFVSMIGYIFGQPIFYCYFSRSSAMAVNTSFLFLVLGVAGVLARHPSVVSSVEMIDLVEAP
jgi:hypothetical protein